MKLDLHPTNVVIQIEGTNTQARLWEGTTDRGTPVHCFITRIAPTIDIAPGGVLPGHIEREFAELQEATAPVLATVYERMQRGEGIPLRFFID